jgi:hypothetical protein
MNLTSHDRIATSSSSSPDREARLGISGLGAYDGIKLVIPVFSRAMFACALRSDEGRHGVKEDPKVRDPTAVGWAPRH